jgi:hypothetical protein
LSVRMAFMPLSRDLRLKNVETELSMEDEL